MITAALIGNPNVGKTTLFNLLTGSNQHVGNWPGVTVEKKEGFVSENVKLVDLPGIYAMDTYSNEEKISKAFLESGDVDLILNIVDASNLQRNLYLTMQLKEFNKPIVLILNMVDVAESKGVKIDYDKLSKLLNVLVVPIIAAKGKGVDKLEELLAKGDFLETYNDNNSHYHNILHFKSEAETYKYIEEILSQCLTYTSENTTTISEKLDKIFINKFLAYPIFLAIVYFIFQFTFSWVGQPLADLLDSGVNDWLVPHIQMVLSGTSNWFKSFIVDGIIGGVGSVIVFLPVILTLFLCISFLEDSGYMARVAFLMDKIIRKMGLSGKAFIPLIIGFGCSVPGVMSTRTLESEKDRKMTALLVPLMSCNARLPVYLIIAGALFKGHESIVVASLYALGIIVAFLVGILFKNTIFKKDDEPFIIELPEYKLPEVKSLAIHTWEKGKGFLRKAGTIIFSVSIIVWVLSNFNFSGMTEINSSFIAAIGKFISPIFIPLGFASWQNTVALLTGIMAKEVVVGTMGVIYGGNLTKVLPTVFTPLSAISFLVFVLLYTPCISLIATMKKEYGGKMAIFSVIYQLVLAWIVSFIVFNGGSLILRIF
ncbi:ferrous iron transport protein B [Thermoanaerobacterium thermosaccharolyticum DSM 571]|uniref:Ferrous iron transport protein B n=1 Tax=Thermoanaerobacterium thermosaccharolyticum (strain ATCC 7956 / DSM 571 / NCIMB 9385 / NCA 3814 / NCTC 13789 / WDCM 00135 / 2032) TaxID=580327 RepID=D9TQZ5_THETC|nr:ferrous iron transport protein B [Thermoanaerobacterium thermosaccharolyticum]ADL69775.1 ferrous iron transport protein B [Thermoanaerobacterium thermosaccharolyticum DSM 571]